MEDNSFHAHRWITPKVQSFNSPIEGLGIRATEPISQDEIIGVLGGAIVPRLEIEKYQEKFGHVGIQIEDNFWICPTSRKELQGTGAFNHSCNPNSGYLGSIIFGAMRDIKPEEELTFDYAMSESFFDTFDCKCGSVSCREVITQDDWKKKELQQRYRDYFSPYLKKRLSLNKL